MGGETDKLKSHTELMQDKQDKTKQMSILEQRLNDTNLALSAAESERDKLRYPPRPAQHLPRTIPPPPSLAATSRVLSGYVLVGSGACEACGRGLRGGGVGVCGDWRGLSAQLDDARREVGVAGVGTGGQGLTGGAWCGTAKSWTWQTATSSRC